MRHHLVLSLLLLSSLVLAYETGPNLLVNGDLEPPCTAPDVPHGWTKHKPNTRGGTAEVKLQDGGVLMHFTSEDYVDQIRLKQTVYLEPDCVYEFSYQYRSAIDTTLKADASLIGTGVFLRAWWQVPAQKWTTVKGLFHQPKSIAKHPDISKPNQVIVLLQNRSRVKLWYRHASLRKTNLKPEDIAPLQPKLRVHSVSTEDVFILPDAQRTYANFILNGLSPQQLQDFRLETAYYPTPTRAVSCTFKRDRVSVPMTKIATGKHPLIAKLFRKADNALVSTATVMIQRLDAIPEDINLNHHELFRTPTGKKLFPLGLYTGTGWYFAGYTPKKFKEKGFNVLFTYGSLASKIIDGKLDVQPQHKSQNLKLLDDAHKEGMWIMMQLPWQYAESPTKNHMLPHWMGIYQKHPALLGWYVDEMRSIRNTPYSTIDRTFKIVKKADPLHPWIAYENPDPELRNNMDAILIGINSPAMVKTCKLNLGQKTKIFHCFGQIDFQSTVASSLDYNQYNCVMPIIWGARGIFYFTFRNLWSDNVNAQCKELAPRVLNTFQRLAQATPAVISEQPLPAWTNHLTANAPMETAFFALEDTIFLFCGVHENAPGSGTLKLPLPQGLHCHDLLNNRSLPDSQVLSIALKPGQARIIRLQP